MALGIDGDRWDKVKLLGPVQIYEVILSEPPVSCMVLPMQTGELLEAVAVGLALTTTVVVSLSEQPLLSVAVRV